MGMTIFRLVLVVKAGVVGPGDRTGALSRDVLT